MKTNNILKTFLVASALVLYVTGAIGQTRYFDERYIYTQAQLNPQLINPGAFGSALKQQILVNYRNKWSGIDGAPRTLTLSYNGPVGNRLGVGVSIVSDKFGSLETTKGALGLSYMIKSETNQIGFGLSAEYIKHGLSGFGNADPNDPVINLALGEQNILTLHLVFMEYIWTDLHTE
ncbi:MAG: PorP/SprF family type IX secretion system membrane protein [Saprospiraceae bacterium]|nr:PorP/SprF family type IX secretion system membrane protein [Saprospiraceae bacterium]